MANALDRCQEARALWLSASSLDDLDQVEALYRQALNSKQRPSAATKSSELPARKKQKKKKYAELSAQDYRTAGERLSLLYCQSGRTGKAEKGLEYLGFVCRLAKQVLDYPLPSPSFHKKKRRLTIKPKSEDAPCVIYDDFLQNSELEHLKSIFENPRASYWTNHNYQVEPPSPYFSYVFPLRTKHNKNKKSSSFVDQLVQKIWKNSELNKKFPTLSKATHVEMWAHNRPHASGHQMHFDSDDEGRGGVRNPILSTILYITADGGGPSLVTNQRLDSTFLADKGWLAHPKTKRLVAFDGRVLHGVVPGKGVPKIKAGRRVTLMFAFWKSIRIRQEETPGSARPFPPQNSDLEWAKALKDSAARVKKADSSMTEQSPIELDSVYEDLEGRSWRPKDGILDYDQVFQGF